MVTPRGIQADPHFDVDFLGGLASAADRELERHSRERVDWTYHDILTRESIARRSTAPPVEVSPDLQAVFLGNLAVEKGHAEYDRIVSEHLQAHPTFRRWKNVWIAEEEPHGAAMLEWAKVSGLFGPTSAGGRSLDSVHHAVAGFLRTGLTLRFDDAAFALAYPAFQEVATRITHLEVKRRLPREEKEGRRLLARVIADEERHERFYCNMVRHALQSGDLATASHQMCAIARACLTFAMPGIDTDIPDGTELAKAYRRTGAFTPAKLASDVVRPLISGAYVHGWNIANVDDLDDRGRRAQELILAFDRNLANVEGNDRRTLLAFARARARIAGRG